MYRIKWNRCLLQRKRVAGNPSGRRLRTIDHGAEKLVQKCPCQTGRQDKNPARADARILPLTADVAVARARSRDAAFPCVAARSRADRTAMADPARADRD